MVGPSRFDRRSRSLALLHARDLLLILDCERGRGEHSEAGGHAGCSSLLPSLLAPSPPSVNAPFPVAVGVSHPPCPVREMPKDWAKLAASSEGLEKCKVGELKEYLKAAGISQSGEKVRAEYSSSWNHVYCRTSWRVEARRLMKRPVAQEGPGPLAALRTPLPTPTSYPAFTSELPRSPSAFYANSVYVTSHLPYSPISQSSSVYIMPLQNESSVILARSNPLENNH